MGQHMYPISTSSFDVGSKLNGLLGPALSVVKPNVADRISNTHYDLPDKYRRSSLKIKETIEGFIMDDSENWYTTICLPWASTEELHYEWNEWHFNTMLASRVPHEGVSRLVSGRRADFRASNVRRGLAFIMEADYYNQPEGVVQFFRNVMGIAQCVRETQHHDTIGALLVCKTYKQMWMDWYGPKSVFSEIQVLDDEIANYGSFILSQSRVEVVVADHRQRMIRRGSPPDMMIMFPKGALYMNLVRGKNEEKQVNWWGLGPDGNMILKPGPLVNNWFLDMPIVETREFDVYDDAPPVDLLTRRNAVVEYYTMHFREVTSSSGDRREFESRMRDVYVYNRNRDNFSKILFKDNFLESRIFERHSNNYHSDLQRLVDSYNANQRQRKAMLLTGKEDDNDENMQTWLTQTQTRDTPPPFFLATHTYADGKWMLAEKFGQIDLPFWTPTQQKFCAQTLMDSILLDSKTQARAHWDSFLNEIRIMEDQRYDLAFTKALQAANVRYSIDETGAFVGEDTPVDLEEVYKSRITQWKGNSYGSLYLPDNSDGTIKHIAYPPCFFANIPGVRTIVEESQKAGSPWKKIGKKLQPGLDVLQTIVDAMRKLAPEHPAVNEKYRSPWFHASDPVQTFYSTIVMVDRPPAWMAFTPVALNGRGLAKKPSKSSDDISWNVIPLPIISPDYDKEEAIADIKRQLSEMNASVKSGATPTGETIFFYMNDNGNKELLDASQLKNPALLSKDVKVMLLMGEKSLDNFWSIMKILNKATVSKEPSKEAETKQNYKEWLLSAILAMAMENGVKRARQLVRGLFVRSADESVLLSDIVNISKFSTGKPSAKKAALTWINSIRNEAGAVPDEGLIQDVHLKDIPFTLEEMLQKNPVVSPEMMNYQSKMNEILAHVRRMSEGHSFKAIFTFSDDKWIKEAEVVLPPEVDNAGKAVARNKDIDHLETLIGQLDTLATKGNLPEELKAAKAWIQDYVRSQVAKPSDIEMMDVIAPSKSKFYRIPGTMSLAYLESLSSAGANALIRPSDRESGHRRPFVLPSIPNSTTEVSLPKSLYEHPSYAQVSAIQRDPATHRTVENFSFISPFLNKSYGSDYSIGDKGDECYDAYVEDTVPKSKGKRGHKGSHGSSKRSKVMDASESDEEGASPAESDSGEDDNSLSRFTDPEPGWTKKELKKRHHKVHDVRRGFEGHPDPSLQNMMNESFVARYKQANQISDPLLRAFIHLYLMTPCDNKTQWIRFIDANIMVPLSMMMLRWIYHEMASCILMKGGLGTGANLYSHANFATGGDVATKQVYGNFTFYSKAFVWTEKNIIILDNVKPMRYLGGMNTSYITDVKDLHDPDLNNRDRGSVIVLALPPSEPLPARTIDFLVCIVIFLLYNTYCRE